MLIADPWSTKFIDVESLNATVSDAIIGQVSAIRETVKRRNELPHASCTLVLGPPGAGKTHLFARLRKRLGPGAALVHLRPDLVAGLTPRALLAAVIEGLRQQSFGSERTQIEILIGAFFAHFAEEGQWQGRTIFAGAFLQYYGGLPETERRYLIERTLDDFFHLHRTAERSSKFLGFLLDLPFISDADRRARLVWLSGQEPGEEQLHRLGVSGPISDIDIIPALKTFTWMAALGTPLVVVFDQLENLIERQGVDLIKTFAGLVGELVEIRGLVIVECGIDTEWQTKILPNLALAERDRLAKTVMQISLPNPVQKDELLRGWLASLPDPVPFPGPFAPEDLIRWRTAHGMTPRMLLSEFQERFTSGPEPAEFEPAPDTPHVALCARWEIELEKIRLSLDRSAEDGTGVSSARLASGLLSALRFLGAGATASPDPRHVERIVFEKQGVRTIVIVLQERHYRTITRIVREAAALGGGTVILREAAQPLRPTWRATIAAVDEFRQCRGKSFYEIGRDDVARMLALEAFLSAARSCEISDARGVCIEERSVWEWVTAELRPAAWDVIVAITAPAEYRPTAVAPQPAPDPARTAGARSVARALAVLERLQLASLERLLAEVRREDPATTLHSVRADLVAAGTLVRWYGRAIVALGNLPG